LFPDVAFVFDAISLPRCIPCTYDIPQKHLSTLQAQSGRYDNTHQVSFAQSDTLNPFAHGTSHWVAKGTYLAGPRRGQACVAKWKKSAAAALSDDLFAMDLKVVDKALEIIHGFSGRVPTTIADRVELKLNVPTVREVEVEMIDSTGGTWEHVITALVEPFIENYREFDESEPLWGSKGDSEHVIWAWYLAALSHFSYHATGGKLVLCDLRGGIPDLLDHSSHGHGHGHGHREGEHGFLDFAVTHPVIHSRTGEYGVNDMGLDGIRAFFDRHQCTWFCNGHGEKWTAPRRWQSRPKRHGRAGKQQKHKTGKGSSPSVPSACA